MLRAADELHAERRLSDTTWDELRPIAAAQRGARLFLTDINDAPLQATADEIRGAGGIVDQAEALDISDHERVAAMAGAIHAPSRQARHRHDHRRDRDLGKVETLSHEQWRRVIDVGLMGPIHVIESFVPAMIAAGRGGQPEGGEVHGAVSPRRGHT